MKLLVASVMAAGIAFLLYVSGQAQAVATAAYSTGTSVAYGTLTLPQDFGGTRYFTRAETQLSNDLAQQIRDSGRVPAEPFNFGQQLVDGYGSLSNLQFFTGGLSAYGDADQQIVDEFNATLADLEESNPGWNFSLALDEKQASMQPFSLLITASGDTELSPVDDTSTTGTANVSIVEVNGTITATPSVDVDNKPASGANPDAAEATAMPADEIPHISADNASISGIVTDEQGHPLENIRVTVYDFIDFGIGSMWIVADYIFTGADGTYQLAVSADGKYRVGFRDYSGNYVTEFYYDEPSLDSAQDVYVTAGSDTGGIDAAMTAPGVIEGTITNESGNPVEDVKVIVSLQGWDVSSAVFTDASGNYSIGSLWPGSYTVAFRTNCAECDHSYIGEYFDNKADDNTADPVQVAAGGTARADASLARAGSISGTITDQDGQPLGGPHFEGFYVEAYMYESASDSWVYAGNAMSGEDGRYTVDALAPGLYKVWFNREGIYCHIEYTTEYFNGKSDLASADPVTVTGGNDTDNIDAVLSYLATGSISGTVRDGSGQPLENIEVEAFDGFARGRAVGGKAVTDAAGHYEITDLMQTDYKVAFSGGIYLPELYNEKPYRSPADADAADPVTVATGDETSGIDASLAPGGTISGAVTDEAGQPIANVDVTARRYDNATGYWWYMDDWGRTVATDASGNYEIAGLYGGDYRIYFDGSPVNFIPEYYDGKQDAELADTVLLAEGGILSGIDATLASAGNAIAGTITNDAGQPLEGIEVHLYVQHTNGVDWYPMSAGADTVSGPGGNYIITGLENGRDYKIKFIDPQGNFVSEYFDNQFRLNLAYLVTATEGAVTAGIDASLERTSAISGNIKNASGQPLRSIKIRAYRLNEVYGAWEEVESTAVTDAAGNYILTDLISGEYKVRFTPPGRVSEYYDDQPLLELADPVPVVSGSDVTGINASLDVGGSISGMISSESGEPLKDVTVWVYSKIGADWVPVRSIPTDINGNYMVTGIAAGDYIVGFGSGGNEYDSLPSEVFYDGKNVLYYADQLSVADGQDTSGIDASLLRNPGRITGTVTDETGLPLAGAGVNARRIGTAYGTAYTYGDAETDANGNFSIEGLYPGDYEISFGAIGYLRLYYDGKSTRDTADPVAVSAGNETSGIDATLVKAGFISGTITDEAGQPLEDIYAIAYRLQDGVWKEYYYGYSDENGYYTIGSLTTGDYKVGFGKYNEYFDDQYFNGKQDLDSADLVPVTLGSETPGVDASLTAATSGSISGKVTDESGQPLAAIEVGIYELKLWYNRWDINTSVVTDSNGNYTISGLQTGEYKVGFNICEQIGAGDCDVAYLPEYYSGMPDLDSSELVPVTWGEDTGGVDASLAASGSIAGTVTAGSGNPLADVDISVERLDAADSTWRRANVIWSSTGADGTYTVPGLPSGDYKVSFYKSGYDYKYFNDKDEDTADLITVTTGATTTGIDAVLTTGTGSISGTVTNESGLELSNLPVYLYLLDNATGTWEYVDSITTDAVGQYSLTGLQAGDYIVSFNEMRHYQSKSQYAPEFYNGKADTAAADIVSLADGAEVAGIDASLTAAGVISGKVTDEYGQPLANIGVFAFLVNPADGFSGGNSVLTDASGNYSLDGLNTGDYKVNFGSSCFFNCTGGYAPEYYDNMPNQESAAPVTVTAGGTTSGINASLAIGGAVTGSITNELGELVDFINFLILKRNVNTGEWDTAGYGSSVWGSYSFGGLAAGDYTVGFYSSSGHSWLDFSERKNFIYRLPQFYDRMYSPDLADTAVVDFGETTSGIDAVLEFFDKTAPEVAIDSPAGVLSSDFALISASYSDGTGLGMDVSSVKVNLDGNDLTGDCVVGIRSLSCPISGVASGDHDVLVSISDYAGNRGSAQSSFTVNIVAPDITPPTTTDNAPAGWQNTDFTVNLNCIDNPGGAGCKETRYSVDGGPYQSGNAVLIDTDGDHTIDYYSTDNEDNTETSHTVHAMLDKTAPSVSNIQPAGNISSNSVTISADFSDSAGGSGIDSGSAGVTLDGSPVSGCGASATGVSCAASGLAEGTHTVSVSIRDGAGNSGSASGSFTVDSLIIDHRTVNTSAGYGTLTLPPEFSASPEYIVRAGTPLSTELTETMRDGGYLPQTPYTFGQELMDSYGTLSNMDFLTGGLPGYGMADQQILNYYNTILANLQAANPGWTFSLQPTDNSLGTESFILTGGVLEDTPNPGTRTLVTGTADVQIYEVNGTITATQNDATPPTTTDNAPAGWQNADFTVNLNCTDNPGGSGCKETRYSVDGGPYQSGNAVLIDTEGDHTIDYYSTDNEDNTETSHTVHAMLDKTAPEVEDVQPTGTIAKDSATASASFLETGSGIDTALVAVSLDGSPLSGCSISPSGVSCPVSGLGQGGHVLSINVKDRAGNDGSARGGFNVESDGTVVDEPDDDTDKGTDEGEQHTGGSEQPGTTTSAPESDDDSPAQESFITRTLLPETGVILPFAILVLASALTIIGFLVARSRRLR